MCLYPASHPTSHPIDGRKKKRQGYSMPCLDPRLTILDIQVDVVGLFQVADEALIAFLL